ncbi:MAG: CDP-glycerol--glycerophosphate glycerophosphotransferase [Planctomycetota bacterium]
MSRGWRALRDGLRFRGVDARARRVVVYAEDEAAGPHLAGVVAALVARGCPPTYLTSSTTDPMLERSPPGVRAFFVGAGLIRTWLFMTLRADVLLTSTPDLETFQLKRSRVHPVHYVYLFHSMVSTHMIYRPAAFDAFDTILCVGPHHVREIRAREACADLPAKRLVAHGYAHLETLSALAAAARATAPIAHGRNVLIAPSWGPDGLFETCGAELVEPLLAAGWSVTLRPHPMTRRRRPEVLRALEQRFASDPRVAIESDVRTTQSLLTATALISDWSGVALEYAFATERPVLFVDVPRKVNNPDYRQLACEPVEVALRSRIGAIVGHAELAQVPQRLAELVARGPALRASIRQARDETVFRVRGSAGIAAEAILAVVEGRPGIATHCTPWSTT